MTRERGPDTAGLVTQWLAQLREGDPAALDRIFPLVYSELRDAAARLIAREAPGHTLEPTALVHEVWLKFAGRPGGNWSDRQHFVAVAARAMRQVLVDHARRRKARKRQASIVAISVELPAGMAALPVDEMLALDDALVRLEALNERLARVVELRFFGGLAEDEIAALLAVTTRTVQRDWQKARAWLHKELYESGGDGS